MHNGRSPVALDTPKREHAARKGKCARIQYAMSFLLLLFFLLSPALSVPLLPLPPSISSTEPVLTAF
jgi:hypothetical protein